MIHLVISEFDSPAYRSFIYIARTFVRAFGQRQAFGHGILYFACCDDMVFVHPRTVAISDAIIYFIYFAVGRFSTKRVPPGTHDKLLRHATDFTGPMLRALTNLCETERAVTHCYPGYARDRQKLKFHWSDPDDEC